MELVYSIIKISVRTGSSNVSDKKTIVSFKIGLLPKKGGGGNTLLK